MQILDPGISFAGTPIVRFRLRLSEAIEFQPDVQIRIGSRPGAEYVADMASPSFSVAWLPRGEYEICAHLHDLALPGGRFQLRLIAFSSVAGERTARVEETVDFTHPAAVDSVGLRQASWSLESAPGTVPVEDLAWTRGHEDWFFRHFDHAAQVVADYLLGNHPLLKGRILDVGCGDGIIDLGIFLRQQPEQLIGIDPFRGYERLAEVVAANHLPPEVLDDERLSFLDADANHLPWPDDSFDVVVSWGSLEHIAGGYERALLEIRRVLKNGGLLFAHPGLFYGALGNHLGEFFDDPFIHLKLSETELRKRVLAGAPRRMDRAGHVASPEEYWRWYTELNPIRTGDFERQLRSMGFEPWRAALRTTDLIEYTPELQDYPIQDLATAELYLSAWNRK